MMKKSDQKSKSRRTLIKGLAGIPLLTFYGRTFGKSETGSRPEINLPDKATYDSGQAKEVKGKLPHGNLGNLSISRMILGCNTITAASHSRDLVYTNSLFRAYNTEEKIIQTLKIAEDSGVNTFVLIPETYQVLNKYRNQYKSEMKTICMARIPADDFFADIQLSIDSGADAVYIHGRVCDAFIRDGKLKELTSALEYIMKKGIPAGVGAHCLETIQGCEKEGIPSDFYLKTFHHDKYWSALPQADRVQYMEIGRSFTEHNKYCDNMWDIYPERTVQFMKEVKKPFIAFKVLAAGAIRPNVGFRYAFENGADFICVGMFDFQVVDDVNTACEILGDVINRERKWFS
jgi:hypothetical protein